jgi:hypothetical protein
MFRPCWVIFREQAGTTESSRLQYTVHSQQHILTQLESATLV